MEKNKLSKVLVKICVSAVLIAILYWKVDVHAMQAKLQMVNSNFIIPIIACIILNYVISALRWKKLLIFDNTSHISATYLVYLYFTGSFFNNFMPTSVGGDVYKIIKLGSKINSKTNAFSATFMERFLGVIALLVISAVGLAKMINLFIVVFTFGGIIGTYLLIKLLNYMAIKNQKVRDIVAAIVHYKNYKNVITYAFVLSFLVQFFSIFSQYLVFMSIGETPPMLFSFVVLPLITLAGFFIPSLNGIGVQDALYISLFSTVGISSTTALTASILYHIFRLLVSLIGGFIYAAGLDE